MNCEDSNRKKTKVWDKLTMREKVKKNNRIGTLIKTDIRTGIRIRPGHG
jgi:hypothetical protein